LSKRAAFAALLVMGLLGMAASLIPSLPSEQTGLESGPAADFVPQLTGGAPQRDHTLGSSSESARVRIVAFIDFLCPHCAAILPSLKALVAADASVQLVIKHFPIDPHCNHHVRSDGHAGSCALATLGQCLDPKTFWAFFDATHQTEAFDNPDATRQWIAHRFSDKANDVLDCAQSPAAASKIAADIALGVQHGVDGTPVIFVNGERLTGEISFGAIYRAVAHARHTPQPH
jgi:protein-disulfide isomerase